jgi:hypothetical protein
VGILLILILEQIALGWFCGRYSGLVIAFMLLGWGIVCGPVAYYAAFHWRYILHDMPWYIQVAWPLIGLSLGAVLFYIVFAVIFRAILGEAVDLIKRD